MNRSEMVKESVDSRAHSISIARRLIAGPGLLVSEFARQARDWSMISRAGLVKSN